MLTNILITTSVIIAFILIARKSRCASSKHGDSINIVKSNTQEVSQESKTFTVATFNIQGGKNLSGNRDIRRASQAIKNADLVGIQEVYAPTYANRLSFGHSQTETLAQPGSFNWLFCATKRRWFRDFQGNALLSKLTTKDWSTTMLPHKVGKNFRNMTVVKVSLQGEDFHFINTHLHTKEGKEEQFNAVVSEFKKYPRAILVGDFNSMPNEAHMLKLLQDDSIVDAINVCGIDPDENNRIDWILCKGFHVHQGLILEKGISDHPYYQVTMSIY